MAAQVFFALADYEAASDEQLSLVRCQTVTLIEKKDNGWWWVESNGCHGYVPSNFLTTSFPEDRWQDNEYFNSYGYLKIHREMLSDYPRTSTYKKAIENGRHYFDDLVILDIGCGTGILSLFYLTKTDVRRVYAVEASPMATVAREILKNNVDNDARFEVIQAKVEDIELPGKVDVIISEWMGTFLLTLDAGRGLPYLCDVMGNLCCTPRQNEFEMVLESVLVARDKWLKPDGIVWPSSAQLFLAPCQAKTKYDELVGFWANVHGYNFSCLIPQAIEENCNSPIHDHILEESDVLAAPAVILNMDLKVVQLEDLEEIHSSFSFEITCDGTFHGFASWFDVTFGSLPVECYKDVTLSTGPSAPLTHWKQDLFMFPHPFQVQKGDKLEGKLLVERNKEWRRHLRIKFDFTSFDANGDKLKEYSHSYSLWK